ncbi:MAG: hypothetical protein ABUL43_00515 [Hyphomicrobium sp.]
MSAAHAAGYAMAAEDVAECRPVAVAPERKSTALVVRKPDTMWSEVRDFLRFDWLRGRVTGYWHGGAAA